MQGNNYRMVITGVGFRREGNKIVMGQHMTSGVRATFYLLISWLQSPSAVILEPQKIKSDTVSTVSPSVSHEVMGPDAMIFIF